MHTTQTRTVQNISALLRAHGYDPVQYDLLSIAEKYRRKQGGHKSIFEHPEIVWTHVDNHQITTVTR